MTVIPHRRQRPVFRIHPLSDVGSDHVAQQCDGEQGDALGVGRRALVVDEMEMIAMPVNPTKTATIRNSDGIRRTHHFRHDRRDEWEAAVDHSGDRGADRAFRNRVEQKWDGHPQHPESEEPHPVLAQAPARRLDITSTRAPNSSGRAAQPSS